MIDIICEVTQTLPISALKEFQGELKTRDENDYDNICASIKRYGIAFPFFVWRDDNTNYVLDGHGRLGALERMRSAGYIIPPLPVIYIEAESKQQAKKLLLRLNSRYGEITTDGVKQFLSDVDADLDGLALPKIPDISAILDNMLADIPNTLGNEYEPPNPKFELFCPECSVQHEITDNELQEIISHDD